MTDTLRPKRLFVYGTLMFPEVFYSVCRRHCSMTPASLPGYARYAVRNERFPGIVPQPDAVTPGYVTEPLRAADWRQLDEFETDFYVTESVELIVPQTHAKATTAENKVQASVYVVARRYRKHLSRRDWSEHHFATYEIQSYLAEMQTV